MAMRYCGRGHVRILFDDKRNDYRATVSDGKRSTSIRVGLPGAITKAVDSPKAYDEAAHAAISFAVDEGDIDENAFEIKEDGSGWMIVRKPNELQEAFARAMNASRR